MCFDMWIVPEKYSLISIVINKILFRRITNEGKNF